MINAELEQKIAIIHEGNYIPENKSIQLGILASTMNSTQKKLITVAQTYDLSFKDLKDYTDIITNYDSNFKTVTNLLDEGFNLPEIASIYETKKELDVKFKLETKLRIKNDRIDSFKPYFPNVNIKTIGEFYKVFNLSDDTPEDFMDDLSLIVNSEITMSYGNDAVKTVIEFKKKDECSLMNPEEIVEFLISRYLYPSTIY